MSIAYALNLTGTLNFLVRQSTDAETQMVSVERVIQYSQVPQEPPADLPGRDPPLEWPQNGAVSFRNFQLRYREGLDLVLKGISINVLPRQKVGIVGRTGLMGLSLLLLLQSSSNNMHRSRKEFACFGTLPLCGGRGWLHHDRRCRHFQNWCGVCVVVALSL